MARPPRLIPETTFLDAFRVVGLLGQGSMSSVYEVTRVRDGERLALKLVDVGKNADPRAARRFEREVQAGRSIRSEHVARVYESGTDPPRGIAWVAMELVPGADLGEFVRARAPLPRERAREILRQLFDAVAAAHAAGMVHRDLKPENIRVIEADAGPHVKVLDFGIAKSFDGGDVSLTTPGLGTPLWTAPEQAKDGYVPAPSADVWALGLLAFFVLTGKIYWYNAEISGGMVELSLEILRNPIMPASERAAQHGVTGLLPGGFDGWFDRAVNRDPSRRFASAADAWRALDASLVAGRSGVARGRPVERTGVLLLLLIAACAAMGYAIYWLIDSARR